MIVNVTRSQHGCVESVVERLTEPELWEAFHHDITPAGKGQRWDVAAPYVAWEIVKQRLMDKFLSRTLGRTSDTPLKVIGLLRNIAKAQNAFDRHPAMRGAAMLGHHDGWFPVWSIPGGSYSPMPAAGPFVVLGPIIHDAHRGKVMTTWGPTGLVPSHHWLASEDAHTRLLPKHR